MNETLRNIIKKSFIILISIFVIGLIIRSKELYLGFTAGGILSILNFFVMYKDTEKNLYAGTKNFSFATKSYAKRYLILAASMVGLIKIGTSIFLGAAFGLFLIKAVIVSTTYINFVVTKFNNIKIK